MSGSDQVIVKHEKQLAIVHGKTLEEVGRLVTGELFRSPYIESITLVPDHEGTAQGQIILVLTINPNRRGKWETLDSIKEAECTPGGFGAMIKDFPAEQVGSTVLIRRRFRIPLSVIRYIQIDISGRSRDPGDSL